MSLRAAVRVQRGVSGGDLPRASDLATLRLAELADSDRYAVVDSPVLGERVIFAGRRARVPEVGAELVVYRGGELEVLEQAKPSPAALRTIHAVKKVFGGRILSGGTA